MSALGFNHILLHHASVVEWSKMDLLQTSNISRTLVRNEIVDHSDVVGLHLLSRFNTWFQWIAQLLTWFNFNPSMDK